MIYYVFRVLKLSGARWLIAVFVLILVAAGVVFIGNDELHNWLFILVPLLLILVMLVIFNVEVKRDLLNFGSYTPTERKEHQSGASREEVERYVSEIIKALQNLSKDNIGALIILASDNIPAPGARKRRCAGRKNFVAADRGDLFPESAVARRCDDHQQL